MRVHVPGSEIFYYAGGGGIIRIHDGEPTPTNVDLVLETRTLHVFSALVWYARLPGNLALVTEVVAEYA